VNVVVPVVVFFNQDEESRAVCRTTPNLLTSKPHQIRWFVENPSKRSILGQTTNLVLPSSRCYTRKVGLRGRSLW
jgi:hypothetical protein